MKFIFRFSVFLLLNLMQSVLPFNDLQACPEEFEMGAPDRPATYDSKDYVRGKNYTFGDLKALLLSFPTNMAYFNKKQRSADMASASLIVLNIVKLLDPNHPSYDPVLVASLPNELVQGYLESRDIIETFWTETRDCVGDTATFLLFQLSQKTRISIGF